MSASPCLSVVIPTKNGARTLPALLAALARAGRALALEIVAVDSASTDGTPDLLAAAGARVLDLGGRPFNHGRARNRGAAAAAAEVLVFLTQDVEPADDEWPARLLGALGESGVAAAFGRQIPRGASPEEAFLAGINYPPAPRRLTADSLRRGFGPGAILFSNAFGAIRRRVFQELPFPEIVMSEDQAWAVLALRAGHAIRYVPEAAVYHGHRYSLRQAFRRNFDSGSSLHQLGLDRGPGTGGGLWGAAARHLAREVGWIASRHGVAALPHALLYEAVRMLAFQVGRLEPVLPRALSRGLGEAPRP